MSARLPSIRERSGGSPAAPRSETFALGFGKSSSRTVVVSVRASTGARTARGNPTGLSSPRHQLKPARRHYPPEQTRATTPLSRPAGVMTFGDYRSYVCTTVDPLLKELMTAMYIRKPLDPLAFMVTHFARMHAGENPFSPRGNNAPTGSPRRDDEKGTVMTDSASNGGVFSDMPADGRLESRGRGSRPRTPKYSGPDQPLPRGLRPCTYMELRARKAALEASCAAIEAQIARESAEFAGELEEQNESARRRRQRRLGGDGSGRPDAALDAEWLDEWNDYGAMLCGAVRPVLRDAAASLFEQKPRDPVAFLFEHLSAVRAEAPSPRWLRAAPRPGSGPGRAPSPGQEIRASAPVFDPPVTSGAMAARVADLVEREGRLRRRRRTENVRRVRRRQAAARGGGAGALALSAGEGATRIQSRFRGAQGRNEATVRNRVSQRRAHERARAGIEQQRHIERMAERRAARGLPPTAADRALEEQRIAEHIARINEERADYERRKAGRVAKQEKRRLKRAARRVIALQALARGNIARKYLQRGGPPRAEA